MLVKKGLPNIEDLDRLFAGKTANGERGYSTAMERNIRVMDLSAGGEGERIGADVYLTMWFWAQYLCCIVGRGNGSVQEEHGNGKRFEGY
ncbi:hypothetical protein OROMI_028739 [Orobanche minor]